MVFRDLHIPDAPIADLCRRHHIRRLSLFGSVLGEEFREGSDVDVLVEFETGNTPGLGFFTIERELSDLLGRRVDLNTAGSLSRYFRADVIATARPIYDAKA